MTFSVKTNIKDFIRQSKQDFTGYRLLKTLHRPFSTVYRIRLNPNQPSGYIVYLKHYKSRKDIAAVVERDYNTTKFWWETLQDAEEFRVIEPLYFNVDTAVVITRESAGADIRTLVKSASRFFSYPNKRTAFMHKTVQVGRWLQYFQQIPVKHPQTPVSLELIKQYVQTRLDKIVLNQEIEFTNKLAANIVAFLEEQWNRADKKDKRVCYTHSDLSLSNVLVHKNVVTVLDFSAIETGSVFKDLTRFYHQCALLKNKPTISNSFIKKMQESFLQGYGIPNIDQNPLFKIYLMTHRINHLGKTARYWEHSKSENIYNRWIVRNSLKEIKESIV